MLSTLIIVIIGVRESINSHLINNNILLTKSIVTKEIYHHYN